jgi:hypothetical protein
MKISDEALAVLADADSRCADPQTEPFSPAIARSLLAEVRALRLVAEKANAIKAVCDEKNLRWREPEPLFNRPERTIPDKSIGIHAEILIPLNDALAAYHKLMEE